jgi:hypothetical protein
LFASQAETVGDEHPASWDFRSGLGCYTGWRAGRDPAAETPVVAGAEPALVWYQGALAASHVEVVTSHYARKYPLLRWDWLLQACSEERVVTNDPAGVIKAVAEAQQLGSAQALFMRFLLDLGLVLQVSGAEHGSEPVVGRVPSRGVNPEARLP